MKRINLSEHTLDINPRAFDIEQFDFSEIEEFVAELAGSRDYEYEAIKNIMIYLWGGKYISVVDLAKKNYKKKESIQARFQSEDHYLNMLPLPNRLSGVCHMATGTGKSYVIFAIAYLSIIMGKVKRVLVLGPSSTIIEQGLTEKFKEYMFGERGIELRKKLPEKYRDIKVEIKNSNEPIEDNCIVIENINAIYSKDRNSIGDTLFSQIDEVLVLSDEVHHAYSHLDFSKPILEYDFDERKGTKDEERLWMKFIREEKKITRHIGFTGTPYNKNEYFTDVIFNYSIKEATEEKYIKKINPIIHIESDEGEIEISKPQRFEQIIRTHFENKSKYNYKDKVKPITIFINNNQPTARTNRDEFVKALASYLKANYSDYKGLPKSAVESECYEKTIVAISSESQKEYKEQLDKIEETDINKPGGKVEFIFAVNKLSEGWDVDNVFQIVPMEEKVFNSKLLISQVIGRGLRVPRKVSQADIALNYPMVTVTNHEKFASHIKEIFDQVTECDTNITSKIFDGERSKHNFDIINVNYISTDKIIDKENSETSINRTLKLNPQSDKLNLKVEYLHGTKSLQLTKEFFTVDEIVSQVHGKYKRLMFEGIDENVGDLPDKARIEEIIKEAMQEAKIKDNKISNENKKSIELFFNQFLPQGKKKVLKEFKVGNLSLLKTKDIRSSSTRVGAIDNYTSVFLSDDWEEELDESTKYFLQELIKNDKQIHIAQSGIFDQTDASFDKSILNQLVSNKNLYSVNSSAFRTPQNLVIANHKPERNFVIKLIDVAKYIDGWIKSPDTEFYGIDYEYWKAGKDRTRRTFNPDFFIKINIKKYLQELRDSKGNLDYVLQLQDKGFEEIIYVVEIKGEDDFDEVTKAKERWASEHFSELNVQMRLANPTNYKDFPLDQFYIFELLREDMFGLWASQIKSGYLKF